MKLKLGIEIGFVIARCAQLGIACLAIPPQQWFPQAGTSVTYNLSWSVTYLNETWLSSTGFDLYVNNYSTGSWILIPYAFGNDLAGEYQLALQNVSVTLIHAFSSLNSTTLNRTMTLVAGNATDNATLTGGGDVLAFTAFPGVDYYMSLNSDTVQKSGFFTFSATSFVDYFNNELQPGDAFAAPWDESYGFIGLPSHPFHLDTNASILANTALGITAMWNDSAGDLSGTYVADTGGQVNSFTFTGESPSFPQVGAWSFTFLREIASAPPSTTMPGYPITGIVLVAVLGVATIVISSRRRALIGARSI
jgi:Tfp pilus tip-associated adhesin PilY1